MSATLNICIRKLFTELFSDSVFLVFVIFCIFHLNIFIDRGDDISLILILQEIG